MCVSRKPPLGKEDASGSPLINFFPVKLLTVFPLTRVITITSFLLVTILQASCFCAVTPESGWNQWQKWVTPRLSAHFINASATTSAVSGSSWMSGFFRASKTLLYLWMRRRKEPYANLGTDFWRVSSLNACIPKTSSISTEFGRVEVRRVKMLAVYPFRNLKQHSYRLEKTQLVEHPSWETKKIWQNHCSRWRTHYHDRDETMWPLYGRWHLTQSDWLISVIPKSNLRCESRGKDDFRDQSICPCTNRVYLECENRVCVWDFFFHQVFSLIDSTTIHLKLAIDRQPSPSNTQQIYHSGNSELPLPLAQWLSYVSYFCKISRFQENQGLAWSFRGIRQLYRTYSQ